MPVKQLSLPCARCGEILPHNQEMPNHALHAVLTIFLLGLWAIVWAREAARARDTATCAKCGNRRSVMGPATIQTDAPAIVRAPGIGGWWQSQSDMNKVCYFGLAFALLIAGAIKLAEYFSG